MFHPRNGFSLRVLALLALATLACGALAAAERVRVYDPGDLWANSRAPLLEEGFENATFPPGGWTGYNLDSGTTQWARSTSQYHSGGASAQHTFSSTPGTGQNGWLVTPALALPAAGGALTFWERIDYSIDYYKHSLWICQDTFVPPVDGASPAGWTQVAEFGTPPEDTWRQQTVSLAAYGGHMVWLAWRYEGYFADAWWIDDVSVQPNGPVLAYQSHALLTDVCSSGGAGDGNGYLEPGEDGTLSITLQNTGTTTSTGISAVLGTATAGVTITQDTATFPDIPAGGTGASQTAFALTLDQTFTCGGVINFTLTITDASRRAVYSAPFFLVVGVPGAPVTLLSESFDGVTAPAIPTGWTQTDVTGAELNPVTATATVHPVGYGPVSSPNLFRWNCYDSGTSDDQNRLSCDTALDLTGYSSPLLSLSMFHDDQFSTLNDFIQVQVSTDGGSVWTSVGSAIFRYNSAGDAWATATVALDSYAGLSNVMVGILCTSKYGNDVYIDNIAVTGVPITCTTCIPAACTIESCDFTAEPSFGVAPLDVALDATVVTAGCAGTPVFDWDYGDSQTGTGQNVTHTYAAEGAYTVTLTVTVDGETCVTTDVVQVYACQLDCEALADPQAGLVPLEVTFATWTEAISCPGNTLYHWDFGDGEATDEQAPIHLYTAPGMYTATLTVTVEGTTIECVSTVQIVVNPYDLHFLDDQGWSRLCVNSQTGAFEWQVLAGPNAGLYPGVCQISALDGLIDFTTELGLPYDLRLRYQPETGQANGVFKMFAPEFWAGLYDRNVADNPPGCDLSEPAK